MEEVIGVKKTILITEYIACPRCERSLFPYSDKDQEICTQCNVIVVKPGIKLDRSPSDGGLSQRFEEEISPPPVYLNDSAISEALEEVFSKLEGIGECLDTGNIKQILVTNYLCCPKCGKNLVPIKEADLLTLCTNCQKGIKQPAN